MTTKRVPFSPYQAATTLGAIPNAGTSGINWSYVVFETQKQAKDFEMVCEEHGYRTRNLSKQVQATGSDLWSIQYHHYAD